MDPSHQLLIPSFLLLDLRACKHTPITMFFLLGYELTDSMVLMLSHRITNSPDLRRLATHDWSAQYKNSRDAFRRLCEALKRVGMASYIELLQEKYTENDMNGVNKRHFARVDNVKSVYSLVATLSKHSQMLGLMCIGACIGVCLHKYSHFFLKFHKQ